MLHLITCHGLIMPRLAELLLKVSLVSPYSYALRLALLYIKNLFLIVDV